jgi:hypothetical protein|tara:strand:- start:67 stop:990 length:924 start_codon:yes stop_codon:yes gene_type:complete
MAVNKNFVVKNGLEVATDVILADATSKNVGIGSTIPVNTLDVRGGIGATDTFVTGISTVVSEFNVGTGGTVLTVNQSPGRVGVGSAQPEYLLDVRSDVSTGTTALYVQGDVRITGDLNVDDLTLSDISGQSLNISGLSTLGGYVDVNSSVDIAGSLNVVGVTTLATTELTDVTVSGAATVGTLFASAGIFTGSSIDIAGLTTTKDLLVTGVSTFNGVKIGDPAGIITASSASGIVTYFGDGSNLTGIATELIATIGVGSEGTFIGAGTTMIDFKSSNAGNTVDLTAGIATVTVQTGVSLGLAIALGG